MSKFRLSDHRLAIETKRYIPPKVDPKDSLYPVFKVTQDEIHCLLKCEINTTNRTDLSTRSLLNRNPVLSLWISKKSLYI